MLLAIFMISLLGAVALAIYSLGTLAGRWDRPRRVLSTPIPRFAPPRQPQAPVQVRAHVPAPPPVPTLPIVQPAVAGTLATYSTRHHLPRMAKGSIPPPIPAMPVVAPRPLTIDDFLEEDATALDGPRYR